MLPRRLRSAIGGSKEVMTVRMENGGLVAENGSADTIGDHDGPLQLDLGVRPLLSRQTSYPVAVEANLAQIVSHDTEKLFPFSRGEVLTGHRVLGRSGGQLAVELVVLPYAGVRDELAIADTALGEHSFDVTAQLPGGSSVLLRRPDERMQVNAPGKPRASLTGRGLVAAFLAGLLFYGLFLVWSRTTADAALENASAAARRVLPSAANRAEEGRLRGAALTAREGTSILTVLSTVTNAVPDGSHLTGFTMDGTELSVRGLSNDAAPLLAAIEGQALLSAAQFAEPVRRRPGEDKESFEITAQVRKRP
ncbi:PilN domain-containing protein [Parvularcula maris]|nr:PilN domain-containing protein [Parvularcula maris]